MEKKIKVLLVDDVEETRHNIKKLFYFAPDIEVVGEGSNGLEAVQLAADLKPDLVLIDINMPVMDGIQAIEQISLATPSCSVIVMSVQGENAYLRRAMMAGAREYLVKPFGSDELINTIKRVYAAESKRKDLLWPSQNAANQLKKRVITVFSSKGGVGKTTIAINLASLLAKEYRQKVTIVDLDLQFGDVALMLNLLPRRTIAELAQEEGALDCELLRGYLLEHESGLQVLAGPKRPEQAELIKEEQVGKIIGALKGINDYVIIDTPPSFQESVLTALDYSEEIFLLATLDLPTVKNIKLCLEILTSLHYPREKIKLLVNKSSREVGLGINEVKEILGIAISTEIVNDLHTAVNAANLGTPFILSHPQTPISQSIRSLAEKILGLAGKYDATKLSVESKSFLKSFFRRERFC